MQLLQHKYQDITIPILQNTRSIKIHEQLMYLKRSEHIAVEEDAQPTKKAKKA